MSITARPPEERPAELEPRELRHSDFRSLSHGKRLGGREGRGDAWPPAGSQRIFIGCRGGWKEDAVRKLCDKYSAIIGVRFHPHTLRHSMAARYLADNANDLVGLSMLLLHESLNTTRRYSLKTAEVLAEGAERIGW
jgi:integrase